MSKVDTLHTLEFSGSRCTVGKGQKGGLRMSSSMPMEPYRTKVTERLAFPPPEVRLAALRSADYNVFRLPTSVITLDLLSGSGTGAMSAAQWSALMCGDEGYASAISFERFGSVAPRQTRRVGRLKRRDRRRGIRRCVPEVRVVMRSPGLARTAGVGAARRRHRRSRQRIGPVPSGRPPPVRSAVHPRGRRRQGHASR